MDPDITAFQSINFHNREEFGLLLVALHIVPVEGSYGGQQRQKCLFFMVCHLKGQAGNTHL